MLSCFTFFFSSLSPACFLSILFTFLTNIIRIKVDRTCLFRIFLLFFDIFMAHLPENILYFFDILFFIIAFYIFNYYSQISWKFSLFLCKKNPRLTLPYINRGFFTSYFVSILFLQIQLKILKQKSLIQNSFASLFLKYPITF